MDKKPDGRKKKENVLTKFSGKVLADITGRLQMVDIKKTMTGAIPYLIVFYLIEKEAWLYRHCTGNTMIQKLMNLVMYFGLAFRNPVPSPFWWDVVVGIIGAVSFWAFIRYRRKNAKKYRQGVEYGSARWGTAKDIAPYIDSVFDNNIILTMTEYLTMNSRPKNWRFARNKNVIVIGGSGSGKTRNFIKPNLMQLSDKTSYVVTDPKGTIIIECGKMLVRHGYTIKVLNTINFAKSMHYNPFHYIRSEKDILKLVNTIIANTKGEGEKSSEDFWVKAERLLYCALIGFIYYEAPEEEQNFSTLLEFLNASEAREDDEEFKNAVDLMFEELESEDPEHFAVRQYKKYKMAAGKTAKSILISCGARLAPFDIAELREIMSYDEMELDLLGDRKTAKETIDLYNTSDTRGQSRSYGLNYQKTGKELMSRDELSVMDGGKCILQLRGVRPFFSDKYDITKHKRYRELSDYDPSNAFDVEKYLRCELKMGREESFECIEFSEDVFTGLSGDDEETEEDPPGTAGKR